MDILVMLTPVLAILTPLIMIGFSDYTKVCQYYSFFL